jgi:hypothetical protein
MKKWTLAAALVAGMAGLGATTAQAQVRVVVGGGPVAYVSQCPGPGYFWVAGFYNGGYWVPGRWESRGPVVRERGWVGGRVVVRDRDFRGHDRYRR